MTWEDHDDFFAYTDSSNKLEHLKIKKFRRIDKEFISMWRQYMSIVGQNTISKKDMNKFFYKCPRLAKQRLKKKIEHRLIKNSINE